MAKIKSAFYENVRVGAKARITIPSRIARALPLWKGHHLLIRLVGRHIELVPLPKEQLWHWTSEWQKKSERLTNPLPKAELRNQLQSTSSSRI
jgi:bifunctional DNA-binding transcriptional regulator/antitoxin component of YhaV-PrlF toxin-antitoxin module